MLDKHIQISFPTFYLTEFFRLTMETGNESIPGDQYEMLAELGTQFQRDENLMPTLEQLAQHSGTNELSIFLFDLSERLRENPAQKSLESLPGLVEDFINLFTLMMEENESVRDLGRVLDYFRVQKPLPDEPQEGLPQELQEEVERIDFSTFFKQEADRFKAQALAAKDENIRQPLERMLDIFAGFEENGKSYEPHILELSSEAKRLQQTPSFEAYPGLQKIFEQVIEKFESFRQQHEEQFNSILEKNEIPEKVEQEPSQPMTVDGLLRAYFLSEVEEQTAVIMSAAQDPESPQALKKMLKSFKALKEMSMIHGYAGIEYFAEQVLFVLAEVNDRGMKPLPDAVPALRMICDEMVQLENYEDEKQIDKIRGMVEKLSAAYADTSEPELIDRENTKRLDAALKDVINCLLAPVPEIMHAGVDARQEELFAILQKIRSAAQVLHAKQGNAFVDSLEKAIRELADHFDESLYAALADFITGRLAEPELNLEPLMQPAAAPEPEVKKFGMDDAEEVRRALVSAMQSELHFVADKIDRAFGEGDEDDRNWINRLLARLQQNAELADCQSFSVISGYFSDLVAISPLPAEVLPEIRKSMELALERLLSAGNAADYSDIIEILGEVVQPAEEPEVTEQQAAAPVEEEPKAEPLSEEDELEQDFRLECAEQIQDVRQAIEKLKENPDERAPMRQIGSALHSIRSSAHLLNKDRIAEFAVQMEEVSEMFEAIEIALPDDFFRIVPDCLTTLEQLIDGQKVDTENAEGAIEALLNETIVEEAPVEEVSEIPETEMTSAEAESEKPLFAEGEGIDDEMLEIFREESDAYIKTLLENNKTLISDLENEQAQNELEYAAHSLHMSARMLGFREIAELSAGLESVSEAIRNNELPNTVELQKNVTRTIEMMQRLRAGEEISPADLAGTMQLMDLSEISFTTVSESKKAEPQDAASRKHLLNIFLDETNELLEKLNQQFLQLEQMPESATLLAETLRILHTIKGGASMVEFNRISGLAHKLEDFFQVYKDQSSEVKIEMLSPAFTALDLIQDMVESISKGNGEEIEGYTPKLAELDNKLFYFQKFDPALSLPSTNTASSTPATITGRVKKDDKVIKINTDYLDNLVDMASELVVNRTELSTHFDSLKDLTDSIEQGKKAIHLAKNYLDDLLEEETESVESQQEQGDDEDARNLKQFSERFQQVASVIDSATSELNKLTFGFEKNIQQIANLSKTLHQDILQVRMVPVEYLLDRFPRAVRDLAKSQGKRVTVSVEGNNTELDRAVVEALSEPIMHILRNAIDHGIESGEERRKNSKSKIGKISLKARQDKSQIVIDISDDGRGIDLAKVKRKVTQKGLASKEELKKMNEAEILDFIFYPEFSTREKATELSGRGVGLDVVSNQIQKLKGVIRIFTEKNEGTTFSIRVPLTLVVSQALMTRFGKSSVAIPMIAVQESLEVDKKEILVDDNRRYVQAHGKLLPYLGIEEVLNFSPEDVIPDDKMQVIILHDAGVSVALGIGQITGRQEIVIKSLGPSLQNIEYIAGGTILGNGEVALILDYAAVIRMVEFQFFGKIREQRTGKLKRGKKVKKPAMQLSTSAKVTGSPKTIVRKKITGRKPKVLIVDDSSSVRSFVTSAMEKKGFDTIIATDGLEALEYLKENEPDLMITDLEMPKMDGFKLIAEVRKKVKFDEMPIVILTGRTGDVQREKGSRLGANAFIGKPFKESDLIKVLVDFIEF